MRFTVQFKDPGCTVYCETDEAEFIEELPPVARDFVDLYVEWSEYVTIEFDTTRRTATVVLRKES